jgi:anti-anti-sigma factor
MALTKHISPDHGTVTIAVHGRFDYGVHMDFRKTYKDETSGTVKYIIDLRETVYVDSSALGMLLLLREHAGEDNARVRIVNANADIRKILKISNFEKLFVIE